MKIVDNGTFILCWSRQTCQTCWRWRICSEASTKHLESRLEVIQGHTFSNHWKADKGLRITYCMWALESEISKETSEHRRFREPHCHSAPPVLRTPVNIRTTNLIFLEARIIDLHSTADSLGLSSFKFFSLAPKNCFIFARVTFQLQGHPRSLILVPIESAYATSY